MNSGMLAEPKSGGLAEQDLLSRIFRGLPEGAKTDIIDGPIAAWISCKEPCCLYVNDAAKRLLRLRLDGNILGADTPSSLRHIIHQPRLYGMQACQGSNVYSYLLKDSEQYCIGLFIEHQHSLENEAQQQSQQELLRLFSQLPALAIQGYDQDGKVIFWNQASVNLYGYTLAQALGRPMHELVIPSNQHANFKRVFQRWLNNKGLSPKRNCIRVNKNRGNIQVQTSQITLEQGNGISHLYCIDYCENKGRQQAQQLHELEYYDQLTKLPNRQLMQSLLDQTLKLSQQSARQTAVMFIGIDKFKFVNSEFGHEVGDMILRRIADRIIASVSIQDLKSRFGGDVYVLAFSLPDASYQVSNIATRLLSSLKEDLHLPQGPQQVSASIGIALSPHDGNDTATLLKHADAALAQAKSSGGDCFVYFDPELNRSTHREQFIARDLPRALREHELHILFQPQLGLEDFQCCGGEALVRWEHGELGEISPAEFIPVLEQQQSMLTLDYWIAKQVFGIIEKELLRGNALPRIFINLSGATINHENFQTEVASLLKRFKLHPEAVGIEITEHVLINNEPQAVSNLEWCRQQGIQIALDDFGTGFSSLSYLAKLPIDIIKIDKSFISALEQKHNRELVKTIIAIAHSLSMTLICEGVQNKEQEDFLRKHGCEVVQGNQYSPPLSDKELLIWTEQHNKKLA